MENEDIERRITDRIPLRLMVKYSYGGDVREGYSSDISPLGIFIQSLILPPMNSLIKLEFTVPYQDAEIEIRVSGAVIRMVNLDEAQIPHTVPGFGVRFYSFNGNGQEVLNDLINSQTDFS
ncbi:PilZ domain-containing protein [candidate division CSSED10-310 bacterium]|uniref:PilZ domain-containing protein n=1 Tax=candidate division CSSED10-310 bacterium TaxID=2855610 RepID=A0ABV6Z411_UNCC1